MQRRTNFLAGQSGQAFEPFRMLIAAVMALTVLVIIIGAINYFEDLRVNVSKERLFEGLQNAVRQPNGSLFKIENLQFQKADAFSTNSLANSVGLDEKCITLETSNSNIFDVTSTSVTVNENILSDVIVQCDIITDSSSCEIECNVKFRESGF